MERDIKVGIIGCGNMGAAFVSRLKRTYLPVYIYDKDSKKVIRQKGVCAVENSNVLISRVNAVLLAIKPQDVKSFLNTAKESFLKSKPLLITIAAGISTDYFQEYIRGIKVIRVMPNLAAKAGESLSFICRGKFVKKADVGIAVKLLSSVGKVIEIKEDFMDKATSIAGSGPAYIYYFLDSLTRSAARLGFPPRTAALMVKQMFLGAAALVKAEPCEFSGWVSKVASKGGTTEAALEVFRKNNLPGVIDAAVRAALRQAKKLEKGGK